MVTYHISLEVPGADVIILVINDGLRDAAVHTVTLGVCNIETGIGYIIVE